MDKDNTNCMMNNHYSSSDISSLDVIDDWNLDFYRANALKYIQRCKLKGTESDDIQKAINYLVLYQERVINVRL